MFHIEELCDDLFSLSAVVRKVIIRLDGLDVWLGWTSQKIFTTF